MSDPKTTGVHRQKTVIRTDGITKRFVVKRERPGLVDVFFELFGADFGDYKTRLESNNLILDFVKPPEVCDLIVLIES